MFLNIENILDRSICCQPVDTSASLNLPNPPSETPRDSENLSSLSEDPINTRPPVPIPERKLGSQESVVYVNLGERVMTSEKWRKVMEVMMSSGANYDSDADNTNRHISSSIFDQSDPIPADQIEFIDDPSGYRLGDRRSLTPPDRQRRGTSTSKDFSLSILSHNTPSPKKVSSHYTPSPMPVAMHNISPKKRFSRETTMTLTSLSEDADKTSTSSELDKINVNINELRLILGGILRTVSIVQLIDETSSVVSSDTTDMSQLSQKVSELIKTQLVENEPQSVFSKVTKDIGNARWIVQMVRQVISAKTDVYASRENFGRSDVGGPSGLAASAPAAAGGISDHASSTDTDEKAEVQRGAIARAEAVVLYDSQDSVSSDYENDDVFYNRDEKQKYPYNVLVNEDIGADGETEPETAREESDEEAQRPKFKKDSRVHRWKNRRPRYDSFDDMDDESDDKFRENNPDLFPE